jgi:flagellar basal-body rod protein FlgB
MGPLGGTHTPADSTITLLEQALDFRAERHARIASNIANAETPRYQATDIEFEGALKEAMSADNSPAVTRTHPRHLPARLQDRVAISPNLVYRKSAGVGNDLNSVDVDAEMAQLAQNNILYNATAQLLAKKFTSIRLAIDGGR